MTARVRTPRRVFLSLTELAAHLRTDARSLYRYLEPAPGGWRLKPLDEAAYARWRRCVWAREARQ